VRAKAGGESRDIGLGLPVAPDPQPEHVTDAGATLHVEDRASIEPGGTHRELPAVGERNGRPASRGDEHELRGGDVAEQRLAEDEIRVSPDERDPRAVGRPRDRVRLRVGEKLGRRSGRVHVLYPEQAAREPRDPRAIG
jgi:hypothetical protein